MNSKKSLVGRILLGIGLFIVAAAVVIGLLLLIKPIKPSTSTTDLGPKADDVLTAFVKQGLQTDQLKSFGIGIPKASQPMTYFIKSDDPTTYVGLQSSHQAVLSGTTPLTEAQITSVQAGVTSALKPQAFTEASTPVLPAVIATYTTTSGTSCSLLGTVGATQLNLVCADRADYTDSLTTTQSLLKQWTGLAGAHYTYVTSSFVQSSDTSHQLASLILIDESNQKIVASLVYTKDGAKSWQYAADMAASDGSGSGGGKVAHSAQTEQLLNDSTYGPLLKKILGTSDFSQ